MQVLLSDKELKFTTPLKPRLNTSSSSLDTGSSTPTPISTPSFSPNTDEPVLSVSDDVPSSPTPPDLDLSLPISTLLREGTMRAHSTAENSGGAVALLSGKLDLQEYIRWMAMLWRAYDALELALSEHSTNPVLAPIYDPTVLARSHAISDDIKHLLKLLPSSSSTGPQNSTTIDGPLPPFPLPPFLVALWSNPPTPLSAYINHLQNLASNAASANGLLAHAYVRYLGDLSGGQVIGARIAKAYGVKNVEGGKTPGIMLYQFGSEGEIGMTGKDDVKKRLGEIKNWFRRGMDEGVGDDKELKAYLVKEANLAFAYNTHLFTLITPPSSTSPSSNNAIAIPNTKKASAVVIKPQRELRYFEKRELEWQEKERLRLEKEGPDNTWMDVAMRFFWFAIAAVIGAGIANYGAPVLVPYLMKFLEDMGVQLPGGMREL